MKQVILAFTFLVPFLASAASLPQPEDLFTRTHVQAITGLKGGRGTVVPGKFVVTLDKSILSDDGVFWAVLGGKLIRNDFQRYLVTMSNPPRFVGAFQGKPTNQVLVQVDPSNPAFDVNELKGAEILVFTIHYNPVSR